MFLKHGPHIDYSTTSEISQELLQKLFLLAQTSGKDTVDFRQYVLLLDTLYNGPSEARLKLCFNLFSASGGLPQQSFIACLRTALMLHLQFSEKTRRKVKKTELADLLEKWQKKHAGVDAPPATSSATPKPEPIDSLDDDLEKDWNYVDLNQEVDKLLPPTELAALWTTPAKEPMFLETFKDIFSTQAGPLQQRFGEISDKASLDEEIL